MGRVPQNVFLSERNIWRLAWKLQLERVVCPARLGVQGHCAADPERAAAAYLLPYRYSIFVLDSNSKLTLTL